MAITQNTYTGDGSTVLFSFTFEYLNESDIKVTLSGTPTTAYTLATATSIQFNTAPANGVAIRIYRDTDIDTLSAEFFPGSAIRAEDLNNNYTQNNYAVQEAKREADAAVTTSNSALNIVTNVVSYDPVVNVAAIPAAPSDGDRIEVFDSTGIESYTPLSGVPSGFIGASTLTVRLIYSVTTWVWQDYQSTDPDARYGKITSTTGSATLPAGTEAQRDGAPAAGYIRFNTEIAQFEGYDGISWSNVGSGATGGTIKVTNIQSPTSGTNDIIIDASGNVDIGGFSADASAPVNSVNIDSSGRLLVGTSSAFDTNSNSLLQLQHESGPAIFLSNIQITDDEILGSVVFGAQEGGGYNSASIAAYAEADFNSNDYPSRLVFKTTASGSSSPTERMRIDSSGNTIFTGSAIFNGSVQKTATQGWLLSDSNGVAHSLGRNSSDTSTASILDLNSQSRTGYIFRANGTAEKYGGTSWTSLSDRRSKENVVNFETGLDEVKNVNPVIFSYVNDLNRYVGVIAQDIENVIPYSVSQREGELPDGTEVDDLRTFDSTSLQFAMLNAIKEMAARIEQLEAKVAALEA